MSITARSTVDIKPAGASSWTTISDRPVGVGAHSHSDVARQRPIPSISPILAVQQLDVRDGRFSITVDDNALTNPIMFLRSGREFDVRIRREGAGAGKPNIEMTGPATINLTNAAGGVRTFRFDLQATAVNRTPQ